MIEVINKTSWYTLFFEGSLIKANFDSGADTKYFTDLDSALKYFGL